jgi:hypothetical protein
MLKTLPQDSRLLSINGGTELLLYGGRVSADVDAIWKYTVADSTWKQVDTGASPTTFEFTATTPALYVVG